MLLASSRNALVLSAAAYFAGSGCVQIKQQPATVSPDQAQAKRKPAQEQQEPATVQDEPPAPQSAAQQSPRSPDATAQTTPATPVAAESPPPDQAQSELPAVSEIRPPLCKRIGTRSEGWYRDERLLIYASCEGVTPECRNSDTRSEGWYTGDQLIEYDQCDGKLPE